MRTVRESHNAVINWLVWLGITRHERRIGAAAGSPISLRVVVPSLTSQPGVGRIALRAVDLGPISGRGGLGSAVSMPSPRHQVTQQIHGAPHRAGFVVTDGEHCSPDIGRTGVHQ